MFHVEHFVNFFEGFFGSLYHSDPFFPCLAGAFHNQVQQAMLPGLIMEVRHGRALQPFGGDGTGNHHADAPGATPPLNQTKSYKHCNSIFLCAPSTIEFSAADWI
jgi:hypothetical protein